MIDSFIARFAQVAARSPHVDAVVDRGVSASYGELFERAVRLGSRLSELGAGPEKVVAIALPKSADYVVAVLGCWLAGAAFLPVDVALPAARQTYMAQAEVALAITSPSAALALPAGVRGVDVNEQGIQASGPMLFDPDQLAYVVFTSGSSGAPKGVLVTHRGLLSLLDAQISYFELTEGDRSLWLLSTAFDASVSDLGTSLLSGASLHIEPAEVGRDPTLLLEALRRLSITYVDLPPALLPHLDERQVPASLKTIVVGGEACEANAVRRWARRIRLVNVYGPTEATVCTSMGVCDGITWDRALLGTELPGVCYEVLDSDGVRSGVDAAGELYISGPCLARGYLGAPELTATRFVTHNGVRCFRTGDRVKRLASGELEFLGRMDRQLKVRGALVAPEEIEAQLARHPSVRRVAVVAPKGGLEGGMTAWLEGDPVPAEHLRAFLFDRVPGYMVPARFAWLRSLPTTTSGKPDFVRLADSPPIADHVARGPLPSTHSERQVAALFTRLFGVEVGLEDNFFSLGGDSIRLIELTAFAERAGLFFGPEVVHVDATVGSIARAIDRGVSTSVVTASELRAQVRQEHEQPRRGVQAKFTQEATGDAVLVTGATGFLGARILHELLLQTSAPVLCLVRSSSEQAGRRRMLDVLRPQGEPLSEAQTSRLDVVLGDLSLQRFGLSGPEFAALGARVGSVFHCGADVSLMSGRQALWPVNVGGTREVLHLLSHGGPKAFHYASTLSVFVSADQGEGAFFEDDTLEKTKRVYGGYAQTKWAAEALVRSAAHGGPCYIHRLGLLTGDSETGRGAARDWLALTLRGLAELGQLPIDRDPRLAVDVTPVDYAARAMVHMAHSAPVHARVETTHLANPRAALLNEWVSAMRSCGVEVQEVTSEQWNQRLTDFLGSHPSPDRAAACLALQRACSGTTRRRDLDLFQATRCRFDDQRTRALLDGTGIHCPAVTPALLIRYVQDILARPRE